MLTKEYFDALATILIGVIVGMIVGNIVGRIVAKKVQKTTDGKRKAYKFVNVGNPDDEEHSPPLDKCGEQYVPN